MSQAFFVFIRNDNRKTLLPLTSIRNKRLFNKAGFSLLEFTLVLIIISALLIVLMPKFNDLQEDAHRTSVQLTANSLQSAVNLAHSVWQSQGSRKQTALLKGFGRGNILMGKMGWPIDVIAIDHNDSAILSTRFALNDSTCVRLWNGLLKDSAPQVALELNNESKQIGQVYVEPIYLSRLINGTCQYRYHPNQGDMRINYDLATGRVIP